MIKNIYASNIFKKNYFLMYIKIIKCEHFLQIYIFAL